jgi:hypothetical protein
MEQERPGRSKNRTPSTRLPSIVLKVTYLSKANIMEILKMVKAEKAHLKKK